MLRLTILLFCSIFLAISVSARANNGNREWFSPEKLKGVESNLDLLARREQYPTFAMMYFVENNRMAQRLSEIKKNLKAIKGDLKNKEVELKAAGRGPERVKLREEIRKLTQAQRNLTREGKNISASLDRIAVQKKSLHDGMLKTGKKTHYKEIVIETDRVFAELNAGGVSPEYILSEYLFRMRDEERANSALLRDLKENNKERHDGAKKILDALEKYNADLFADVESNDVAIKRLKDVLKAWHKYREAADKKVGRNAEQKSSKNRVARYDHAGAKDTKSYAVNDVLTHTKIEKKTDKAHTKSDDTKHMLVDYCTIISDPVFQETCYKAWRVSCSGIADPRKRKRCEDVLKPGGARNADGKIWDFCAFVKSPDGRRFCYDGFRKMIAGSTCGAIQFPPSAESYLCRERARNLPSNLPSSERTVEAKRKCKGGGLVGAINCVTEQMGGARDDRTQKGAKKPQKGKTPAPPSASSADKNTGITTTSVRNPDGTRTVTKTDKNGNVLSKEVVGKSPASASSTDKNTGITMTSVRNPDGTRTVTKTDKAGNILSKEIVGKSPTSASSMDKKTGTTTTSIQNPDGTRTVTTTDKQGNILSREKVR